MRKMVLSILVDNTSGVLSRVSGLFSRRGYNITSLTVGETENPKVSRMTVVVRGEEQILEQIYKQVEKLEDCGNNTSSAGGLRLPRAGTRQGESRQGTAPAGDFRRGYLPRKDRRCGEGIPDDRADREPGKNRRVYQTSRRI